MSRWKAAAIHLSISLVIALLVGALLFGVWYPPPFFHAAGADKLVLLLVGVDVVLGPLLTLIVFKSGKPSLKFDLACIVIVQALALAYGVSVVTRSRPVFLVAAVDRFVLVTANDLDEADLALGSAPEFRTLSWTGPRLAGTHVPIQVEDRNSLLFSGAAGKDIEKYPRYYVDYTSVAQEVLKKAEPLDVLRAKLNAESRGRLEAAVRATGKAAETVVWVPLLTRKAVMVMMLDARTGVPLHAVAVNPW
jgi:hypothetical protein